MRGLAVSSVVLATSTARAQDAEALFKKGLEQMLAGQYETGCKALADSLAIDRRAGTLFTLADCLAKSGKIASAVERYDEYLALIAQLPADQREKQTERVEVTKATRDQLQPQVPLLTVTLPSWAPPGTLVKKDGEPFPSHLSGVAISVDPGDHTFSTEPPGGTPVEQHIQISAGERKTLRLDAGPEPEARETPPPNAPPQPAPSGGHATWTYIAAGLGLAGVVTGTVTGVLVLQKRRTIDKYCDRASPLPDGTVPCDPEALPKVQAASDNADTLGLASTLGFGVGVAGLGAAVVLFLTDDHGSHGAPPSNAARQVFPVASLGPRGGSVGVSTVW